MLYKLVLVLTPITSYIQTFIPVYLYAIKAMNDAQNAYALTMSALPYTYKY